MSASVSRKRLKVKLNCTGGDCAGTLRADKGKRKLGSKDFALGDDLIRKVRIKLNRKGRRALKHGRRIKLTISRGDETASSERIKLERRR